MSTIAARGRIVVMPAGALLSYAAAAMLVLWGVAHVVPTRAVVASFGPISLDNRRILVMEWVAEGITHVSIGALIVLTTALSGASDSTTQLVYRVAASVLLVLATLTALTGARTSVVWFRLCPFVLGASAGLLLLASVI